MNEFSDKLVGQAATRDLLLPKLVTGEIEISNK